MRRTHWALILCLLLAPGLAYSQSPSQAQGTKSTDGAHVTTGAKADAASTDSASTNSLMSFVKGLVKIWNDVWDDGNNRLNVAIQNQPTVNAGTGTFTNQQSNVTADFDTGGGTQNITLFGISLPASGGAVIGGTATNPFIVSGTLAATQSGTWTVQPGNTANTTPWLFTINQGGNAATVNGSGQLAVNCANCSGSGVSQQDNTGFTAGTTNMVPMAGFVGSNAVTSGNAGALQMTTDRMLFTNLGKVGGTAFALGQTTMSASLPVTIASNQGALTVTANAGTGDVLSIAAHTMNEALKEANAIGGQLDDTSPTAATENNIAPLRITAQRAGHMNIRNNAGTEMGTSANPFEVHVRSTSVGSTSADDDGSVPAGTTSMSEVLSRTQVYDSDSAAGDWKRLSMQPLDFDSGAGTEVLSVLGIALPASGGPVIGGTSTNPFRTDPTGTTTQPVSAASLPLPSGAATDATLANVLTSANFAAAFGTAGSADSQVLSVQGIASMTPLQVQSNSANLATQSTLASIQTAVELIDDDQTGATPCYLTSAASTNATNCKASAGRLLSGRIINTTSTIYYLRLYNLATAPTCSSATGFVETIPVPHSTGAGSGVPFTNGPSGEAFGTGIGFCLTGGGSSTDNTNAATGVYLTLLYK